MNTVIDMLGRFLTRLRERDHTLGESLTLAQPAEILTVFVGTVEGVKDGRQQVQFEGRELACRAYSRDNKRIRETLYESENRLLVHTQTLHRVEGLRTECELRELSEHKLRTEFPELSQLRSPLGLERTFNLKPIRGDTPMKKFWQLLQEGIIVQSLVTILFVGATIYLFVTEGEVPPELLALTSLTLGFWFRSKNTYDLRMLARAKRVTANTDA